MNYDTIIIGSGPAGLSAALYASRYRLKTLVIKGDFGGEMASGGVIWNYPGVPSIEGYELMKVIEKQAKDGGAELVSGKAKSIVKIDSQDRLLRAPEGGLVGGFEVAVGEKKFTAKTVILTVGTERRHLNLPNETELTSKGVHYCFTCDAPLYGGKTVAVVGAGDAAFKGTLLAADYCKKIYVLVRSDKVRAEPSTVEQVSARQNVEILYSTEVKELIGTTQLEKIILTKPHNGSDQLVIDGLFIEIGAKPNTALSDPLGVELEETGYIKTDSMMRTNVPGLFVAGDAVNIFGHFKQAITAAALGSVAATSAYQYIQKNK